MPRLTAPISRHRRISAAVALASAAAVIIPALPAQAASTDQPATIEVVPGTDTRTPALVDGIAEPAEASAPADDAAVTYLAGRRDRYAIPSPDQDLSTAGVSKDAAGLETVRLQQKHQGVEVLGGQYVVRMERKSGKRTVTGTSGKYFTNLTVSTTPSVSVETAVSRAVGAVERGTSAGLVKPAAVRKDSASKQAGTTFHGVEKGLIVLPRGAGVLTRRVTVSGTDASTGEPVVQEVYVDAKSGFPVLRYSALRTFQAQGIAPVTKATKAGKNASAKAAKTAKSLSSAKSLNSAKSASAAPKAGSGLTDVTGSGKTLNGRDVALGLQRDKATGLHWLTDYSRMKSTSKASISTWDARDVWVYEASGVWPQGIVPFSSATPAFGGDATGSGAVDAHWGAQQVYDYYLKQHGRDSLDGHGGAINSLVGVTDFGYPYVNAFWDGQKMVYGSGDDEYLPMAADTDVVGHEMTHGVVENTAALVYAGQSGAMNEAVADYFGNAIDVTASGTPMTDPDAGLLGEDLCRTAGPRDCALRDLNDGATTSKNFLGMSYGVDSGGVHLNSTIFSGALWDMREDLGGQLADKIVYRALTSYMTPLDGFTEGRAAVIAAAKELGVKSKELKTVKASFDAHGIVPGWEKALGMDSDTLLGKLNVAGAGTDAGGGWWATSKSNDDGSAPYSIYAGRTDGKGKPQQMNDNNGFYNVYPSTDGKRVVWITYGSDGVSIMSRAVSGGVPKKLYTSLYYDIVNLSVDGDTVVFELGDDYGVRHVNSLRDGEKQPKRLDEDPTSMWVTGSGLPTIKGGKVAYARTYADDYGYTTIGIELYDLKTGKATRLGKPAEYGIGRPAITATDVVWFVDETLYDDNHTAVRKSDFKGKNIVDIVPENGPGAVWAMDLTASDDTVTLTTLVPDTAYRNETSPKLNQYGLDGAYLGRVSCNRGMQMDAAADSGRRVVWIDGTTSATDLVTRARPAGRCG
ncbi:M4 family metallopeptidase [Streptomyces sp. NPDC051569]|uniref:M4 family metallopeptidase n=1 Tax=Streptomyces sp. NPDC051569 TaxID=3365661 RepID=UPI00378D01E5